jgi:cardiolipin synthase A/B
VSIPGIGTSVAERFLALSIAGARTSLFITSSYFVPSPPMRRMLIDAAARGVDVRILTAGRHTDVPTTRYAGRTFYGELLAGGVRIYEYAPRMIHSKTIVADRMWSAVGSMNFDNRSLRLNDEAILVALDTRLGDSLHRIFLADLEHAHEISAPQHARRPLRQRIIERTVWIIAPLL